MTTYDENGNILCDYGCGGVAHYQYESNGHNCCSESFYQCEGFKRKRSETMLYHPKTKVGQLRTKLVNGDLECKYCGEPAKFLINNATPCCTNRTKECPEYKAWFSNMRRESYIDNPKYSINMSKAMKKCQNKPEVKLKKQRSMELLHRGTCEECTEFQENYTQGRDNFRDYLEERIYQDLVDLGIKDIPEFYNERATLLNKIKAGINQKKRYDLNKEINKNEKDNVINN